MKLKFIFLPILSSVLVLSSCKQKEEINLTTLLKEMVNREQLTRFPENGYQSLQASSYNRRSVSPEKPGWFADSDGTGFIRTEMKNGQKEWVLMEEEGHGVITRIWTPAFYYSLNDTIGANIKFYLDGDSIPAINTNFIDLVTGKAFVKPPFAEYTARAGNLYFPVPFEESCKITMDNRSFYNIINYRRYPQGTNIRTFTMEEFREVTPLREKVGKQLIQPPLARGKVIRQQKLLKESDTLHVDLPSGNKAIKKVEIKLHHAENLPQSLRSTILIGHFDGEQTIWAPVGDFFNNVDKIQPYDMWEREVTEEGAMISRWIMPYRQSGAITLKNLWQEPVEASIEVLTDDFLWTDQTMHFYATWRMDSPRPTFPLYDWNFLEAEGKGIVVGDQWTVLNPREGWWGEGDEKIYIDGDFEENFPSHFGTGTEDYYGWAGGVVPTPADQFDKPFVGNIIVGEPRSMGYNVCTRTRVLDAIPFRERIRFDFEASCGTRQSWHYLQYSQTTFWYGKPGVTHNRKPLPGMASKTLPTLEDLQKIVEEAKGEQYIVEGALEAETRPIINKTEAVQENFADIPVWGEVSGGALKNLWFEKKEDYAELEISEKFQKAELRMCATVGKNCGEFDIYLNGRLKASEDFYANHSGVTNPLIDFGELEPVNNAYQLKFVFKGASGQAQPVKGKYALGIDYFILK